MHFSIAVEHEGQTLNTELWPMEDNEAFILPVQPNSQPIQSIRLQLPDPGAAMARQRSLLLQDSAGQYSTTNNNCATHCMDIIGAGGLDVPPNGAKAMLKWWISQGGI